MQATQQKLNEIIDFLSVYDCENEAMYESWRDFRGYYCQAYIWGWKDPDYKQYLREMARLVVGQPSDLIRKIQDRDVISERYYKDGVFNGYENRIEYFDKSSWSKKKRETFYFNGKKHGLFLEWDMYGDKVVEGYYKMERKDGTWMSWLNGIKVEQKTFVKDKKEGLLTRWYENGRVKYKVTYKRDRNIGVKCWDLSGFECTCFTYPDEISCL